MATALPYRPSIFDRVFYWMSRRPARRWLYAAVYVASVMVLFTAATLDGRPAGDSAAYALVNATWAVLIYGSIDFIDREVVRASVRFREVFDGTDEEFETEVYRLSTMPARTAAIVWLVAFGLFSYAALAVQEMADLTDPVARAVQWPFFAFAYSSGPLLVYHTIRLLTGINRLLQRGQVNVFHLRPLYGFSRVTARVGLVYLAVMVLNTVSEVVVNIGGGPNAELWIGLFVTMALAIASFIAPLIGTHRRIGEAKADALQENSVHVEQIRSAMYASLESGDHDRSKGHDDALDGLLRMGQTIDSIPSWPWAKGTLRGFFTAIGIPLVVFIAQRVLEAIL